MGRDNHINIYVYPRLGLRFNQVEFKTPKHGKNYGLPINNNGKTPKTDVTSIALRNSLLNMPNRKSIIWYNNGKYQR